MGRAGQRPPTATEARIELARRAARSKLLPFFRLTFPPAIPWLASWHQPELAAALEAVEAGELSRLMIFMPPQHGKTILCSAFQGWYMGRRLGRLPRVIAATYGMELARDMGLAVRTLVASDLYREIFPGSGLQPDVTAAARWRTADGGSYIATSLPHGPISGRGTDLLVIDDPVKGWDAAASPTVREAIWNWWQGEARTRLSPRGAVVLISTRWHDDDLSGRLLREMDKGTGDQWHVVSYPALAERDEPRRDRGEALWPARFSTEYLEATRSGMASHLWLSLYQQRPPKETGAMFPRDRWKYYTVLPPHPRLLVMSVDTASKAKDRNSWSVAQVWAACHDGDYLVDQWRAHVEFPELKQAVLGLQAKHRAGVVLIEDKSSGESLLQDFQRETRLPVHPFNPGGSDLEIRAGSVCGHQQAGRVFLPEGAPFTLDFVEEHTAFPRGAFNDQVSAHVQFHLWLRAQGGEQRIQVGGRRESAGFVDRYAGAGVTEQRGMARTPEELHRREPDRKKKGPYGGY